MFISSRLSSRQIFWIVAVICVAVGQAGRLLWGEHAVLNPGMAFNIALPTPIIYPVSLLLVAAIGFWLYRKPHASRNFAIGLGLIVGGGLSNLVDRMFLGGFVADYINFLGTADINLADIMIGVGVAMVFLEAIFEDEF